jgi:MFS family permease
LPDEIEIMTFTSNPINNQSQPLETETDFKVIGLIGVAHFFSHLYIYLLPPLFPFLKTIFDVSYTELGFLLAVFSGTTGLTQIPFGFLVDKFGAKFILISGLAIEGIAFTLMGIAPGYTMVLVLMIVAGAANGVYHPADYAILSASVSKDRMGRAFSLHTFAGYAGFAVAGPIIIFLNMYFGWRLGLAFCGLAGLGTAILLMFYSRHLRHNSKSVSTHAAPAEGDKIPEKHGLKLLFSFPILMCLGFFALLSLGSTGIASFLIVALGQQHGTDVEIATLILSTYLVASAVGVLIGGFVADRTQKHNLVAAVCFLSTAIIIASIGAFSVNVFFIFVLMGLMGVMHGAIMPSRDMIVRSVTPDGAFGKVFGFVTSGFSIGGIIAPPFFGWILDQSEPSYLFFGIAAIMLCSMTTVFTSPRRRAN